MRHFLVFIALLLCVHSLYARERPSSFVSDPSNLLLREPSLSLDSSLAYKSNRFGVEIFVLIEPKPDLPLEEQKTHFKNLGTSWTDKNWVIISYDPETIGIPLIVSGGPFRKEFDPTFWDLEFELLRELSLQSWDQKTDLDFLARQISDTLVFLTRAKDAHTTTLAQNYKKQQSNNEKALLSRKIFWTTLIITSLLLLAIATLFIHWIYLRHRKMLFPKTKWHQRLGAPHSGGSSANHSFLPPQK